MRCCVSSTSTPASARACPSSSCARTADGVSARRLTSLKLSMQIEGRAAGSVGRGQAGRAHLHVEEQAGVPWHRLLLGRGLLRRGPLWPLGRHRRRTEELQRVEIPHVVHLKCSHAEAEGRYFVDKQSVPDTPMPLLNHWLLLPSTTQSSLETCDHLLGAVAAQAGSYHLPHHWSKGQLQAFAMSQHAPCSCYVSLYW
jgi:hypothetical protein